jgi:hypothetical protein
LIKEVGQRDHNRQDQHNQDEERTEPAGGKNAGGSGFMLEVIVFFWLHAEPPSLDREGSLENAALS